MKAEDYYRRGNDYRKKGDFQHALDDYAKAIALDSESPAVHAREHLQDIMNFYCKDLLNP